MANTESRAAGRRRRAASARARRIPRRGGWIATGLAVLALVIALGQAGSLSDAFTRIAEALGFEDVAGEIIQTVDGRAFPLCGSGPRDNCVVDGDTFHMAGETIRIADIDTPEISPSRCASEAELGARATRRMADLLSAGPFDLALYDSRDEDSYGRKLRVVSRDGRSLGDILVSEGLAREWTGSQQPWC